MIANSKFLTPTLSIHRRFLSVEFFLALEICIVKNAINYNAFANLAQHYKKTQRRNNNQTEKK